MWKVQTHSGESLNRPTNRANGTSLLEKINYAASKRKKMRGRERCILLFFSFLVSFPRRLDEHCHGSVIFAESSTAILEKNTEVQKKPFLMIHWSLNFSGRTWPRGKRILAHRLYADSHRYAYFLTRTCSDGVSNHLTENDCWIPFTFVWRASGWWENLFNFFQFIYL